MDNSLIGRLVYGLAKYVALAGGVVLVVITAITVISVVGRALIWAGLGPIQGDYELVEASVLFAIFAFLPWCHLERGHAIVAVLTDRFSIRYNVIAEAVMDLMMLAVALFIVWRHWLGMLDKFGYMETTFILRFPLWWTYAAGLVGGVTFIIVAIYCLVRSIAAAVSPNPQMPTTGFAE